jgi:hypothetical protein
LLGEDFRVDCDHMKLGVADGLELTAPAVVLATGASYRRLGVARLEALVGAGVFYGGGITEARAVTDSTCSCLSAPGQCPHRPSTPNRRRRTVRILSSSPRGP